MSTEFKPIYRFCVIPSKTKDLGESEKKTAYIFYGITRNWIIITKSQ